MSWYHNDTRNDRDKHDEELIQFLIVLFLLSPVLIISCIGG